MNPYLRNADLVYRVEEEINSSKGTYETVPSEGPTYINTYLKTADLVYRVDKKINTWKETYKRDLKMHYLYQHVP